MKKIKYSTSSKILKTLHLGCYHNNNIVLSYKAKNAERCVFAFKAQWLIQPRTDLGKVSEKGECVKDPLVVLCRPAEEMAA